MENPQSPINARQNGGGGLRAALGRVLLWLEEHMLWPVEDALRAVFGFVRRPFAWLLWVLQRGLIWPIQDRLALLSGPGRALAAGSALALVAGVAVVALGLVGSGGSGTTPQTSIAAATTKPQVELPVKPADSAGGETLQGAAPVFKPRGTDSSEVDGAKAVDSAPAPSASTSAATGTISSDPNRSPAGATASASTAMVDGPPAGPRAIAVATDFADAFVVFETGGDKAEVRPVFAATATPELTRSLLRRPPRLPKNGEVPKARVMNVVAGPSHGRVYTMSVSLLRVGVTSELRLDMEKLKDDGWQVTNVLG